MDDPASLAFGVRVAVTPLAEPNCQAPTPITENGAQLRPCSARGQSTPHRQQPSSRSERVKVQEMAYAHGASSSPDEGPQRWACVPGATRPEARRQSVRCGEGAPPLEPFSLCGLDCSRLLARTNPCGLATHFAKEATSRGANLRTRQS